MEGMGNARGRVRWNESRKNAGTAAEPAVDDGMSEPTCELATGTVIGTRFPFFDSWHRRADHVLPLILDCFPIQLHQD